AYDYDGNPVTAGMLKAQGAMAALLKDALKPNLVQTLEGVPALIHGGPFANIAHGCNSIQATKMALKLGDIAITEAGFGADLGAEKFLDIKCRFAGLKPDAAVLVATIRALKMHGGVAKTDLAVPNTDALRRGLENLKKHIENLQTFGLPVVVAINEFPTDTEEEIKVIRDACARLGVPVALSQVFAKGGEGGMDLGKALLEILETKQSNYRPLYENHLSLVDKIRKIAITLYGASDVAFSAKAAKDLALFEKQGYGGMPICIAKTQYSFSDDPTLLGRPEGFTVQINEVRLSAGAGFVVALAGSVMTMPGLPKRPAAENIDVDEDGNIKGLF
uniref:formate--tetrahydrofolate ligase n=1 Tax=Prevotella heparinolytica TaxID=28113 RepID=UPI0035A05B52